MGDLQQTQCIDFIMTSCPSASAGACAECAQQRQSPEAAAGAKPAVHASLESFQNPRIAQVSACFFFCCFLRCLRKDLPSAHCLQHVKPFKDKALACSSQTSRLCGQTMLRMCWQTTRTNHAEVLLANHTDKPCCGFAGKPCGQTMQRMC
eukprot:1145604-Pelagomonas_calceolata.AAC.7